ncbi:hypothetical protein GQX73_g7005 [Xylaria multiplex]|uniref:RNA-directed DNA polymerase n=1 Tax=Xylaria multiplex TaxID=323545 RepID=A0A7C8IY80_9PEZI|nr:hypothetical protein GQX73_g7005 [Xylaria multiplex]
MTTPQFAGLPGEDAEIYVQDCTTLATGKPDVDMYAATIFRGGLVGRRVKGWYHALPKATRRSWDLTKTAFTKEFDDDDDSDEQRMLAGEVRALKRKAGEPLLEYVRRTQKLSDRVQDAELQTKLAEAFLCGMRDGEADTMLQLRLQDRLATKSLLSARGFLVDGTTFRDIRKYLGQVATPIGESNIYDERADYPDDDWQTAMSPEERIAAAFEQLSKKIVESAATSQTGSTTHTPVSGNNGGYVPPPQVQIQSRPQYSYPSTMGMQCFRCGQKGHGARDCKNDPLPRSEQNKIIEEFNKRRQANPGTHVPDATKAATMIGMNPCMQGRTGPSDHVYDVPYMSPAVTDPAVQFIEIENGEYYDYIDETDNAAVMASENVNQDPAVNPRGQKRTKSDAFPSPPTVEPLTPVRPKPAGQGAPMHDATTTTSSGPADTNERPPSENDPPRPTVVPTSFREFLAKHKAELDELRASTKGKPKPSTPKDTIPARIMMEGNLPRFDVREWLAQTPITLTAAQLVDSSARIKSQFIRAMAPSIKRTGVGRKKQKDRGKEKDDEPIIDVDAVEYVGSPQCALVHIEDWGEDETELSTLGYIRASVEGQSTNRALLDGGAVIEIISPGFVNKLGLSPRPAGVPWMVRLADDKRQPVTHCVSIQVVTEGIAVIVTAYVMSAGESFDLLLSRSWLKRVKAVEHYASDILEINGKKGVKKLIPIFPASKPRIQIDFGDSMKVMETQLNEEAEEELADEDEIIPLSTEPAGVQRRIETGLDETIRDKEKRKESFTASIRFHEDDVIYRYDEAEPVIVRQQDMTDDTPSEDSYRSIDHPEATPAMAYSNPLSEADLEFVNYLLEQHKERREWKRGRPLRYWNEFLETKDNVIPVSSTTPPPTPVALSSGQYTDQSVKKISYLPTVGDVIPYLLLEHQRRLQAGRKESVPAYTVWEETDAGGDFETCHFELRPSSGPSAAGDSDMVRDVSEIAAGTATRAGVDEAVEIEIVRDYPAHGYEEKQVFTMTASRPLHRHPGELIGRHARREPFDGDVREAEEFVRSHKIVIGDLVSNPEQRRRMVQLLYTYRDCFAKSLQDIRPTDLIEHCIDTDPNVKPFRLRQVRYTRDELEFSKKVFPTMEEADIITKGSSAWAAYTRFPYKKNRELRVVHDYRPINSATLKPQWPMHNRDEDFDVLIQGGHSVFFKADASNGYWAIPVRAQDQWKTAVVTPHGMYLYKRMAQGLCGAPHTYSQFGDIVFGPHPACPGNPDGLPSLFGHHPDWRAGFAIFMDDHLISANTFERMYFFLKDHYFPRIAAGPIYLSGKKTEVCVPNMEAIGFELSKGTIRPNMEHRERFARWKSCPPEKVEEVEAFLYLTSYLKQYVPGRADRARSLKTSYMNHVARITPKGNVSTQKCWIKKERIEWTPEHQAHFEYICDSIQERSCRGVLDDTQFHLATDASDTGTGGVLIQIPDTPPGTELEDKHLGMMNVIMYISHRLSDAETRYPVTEKEALAVLRALAETRWMILPSKYPIIIYTDHEALLVLLRAGKELKGRLARWVTQFSEYDVLIKHRPGKSKLIGIADGLSRLPSRWQNDVVHRDPETIDYLPSTNTISIAHGDVLPFADVRVTQPVLSPTAYETLMPWYGDILSFLIEGLEGIKKYSPNRRRWIKRQAIHHVLRGERLYYVERTGELSLCIGESHVALALKWAHDHHGHYAGLLTLGRLRGKIYWPTRLVDVTTYVMTCSECQQNGVEPRSLIPRTIITLSPWEMVGMDYLGPINPQAYNGHKCILVVVDYCTRYIFTSSTESPSSSHVLGMWEQLHPIFGWPRMIYSDNGTHFTANPVQQRLTGQGTNLVYAPVTHASSVGLVERMVREVKTMLRKWATGKDPILIKTWPDRLIGFTMNINTRRLRGQRYSPSELLLGYQLRHNLSRITDTVGEVSQQGDTEEEVEDPGTMTTNLQLLQHLERRDYARDRFAETLLNGEQDTRAPYHWSAQLKMGDLVWWYQKNPGKKGGISKKLAPKWTGPWEIATRVSDVTWSIVRPNRPNRGATKVHVNQLKPYLVRPSRLRTDQPALVEELETPLIEVPVPELTDPEYRILDLLPPTEIHGIILLFLRLVIADIFQNSNYHIDAPGQNPTRAATAATVPQIYRGQHHILRALSQWPKDTIRPEVQFQTILHKRFDQPKLDMSEEEQLRQANALYSLLDNRYKKTYPITGSLLQPKSNPTYFTDLLKELEEAPNRSFFERFWLRMKGIVRLQ